MRWTRLLRKTNAALADGEVVWSWRPTLASSFAVAHRSKWIEREIREVMVAKEPGSPRRARSKP
jgi:hypothetical protein